MPELYFSLLKFVLSSISGFLIFFALYFSRQSWANTLNYFVTFILLPPITFVITVVISNNLALSLGMIGALSIIRFRTPVKSPLELVVYFLLITLGIAFQVNYKWGILLCFFVILTLILSHFFDIFIKKNNGNLFKYSFSTNDGIKKNLVEIQSSSQIDHLEKNNNLIFSSSSDDCYIYKLSFTNRKDIEELKQKVTNDKNIKNFDTTYYN